jgi:hypothetical protein
MAQYQANNASRSYPQEYYDNDGRGYYDDAFQHDVAEYDNNNPSNPHDGPFAGRGMPYNEFVDPYHPVRRYTI